MDNYRQELAEMGIVPFDEQGAITNMMNMGNSMIKRRRSMKSQKASQLGTDPVEASFAGEEGIYDSMMDNTQKIKQASYENQFKEADFAQNSKIKGLQTELLEDEVNGSWLDDVLGIADLGISLADVTGLGSIAGGALKNLFGGKKKAIGG